MDKLIIIRYGEINLKGLNRGYFEDRLLSNVNKAIKKLGNYQIYKKDRNLFVEIGTADPEPYIERISRIFGIVSLSLVYRIPAELEIIYQKALELVQQRMATQPVHSFKVECRRSNKQFPLTSPEIGREVGAFILDHLPDLKVDVFHPELKVYVDLRDQAYLYTDKIPGFGGMPYGTNGKALLLLPGGIDSPVAGWMMAKRGVAIEALHFHSYPFTSERAKEKVVQLTRILSTYCRRVKLYSVNLLNIQSAIKANCPEELFTILSRRYMMFIAELIARQNNCDALITGENIGQVASQTINSLQVTNAAVDLPVFRPVIALDKMEIVDLAVKIGTYDTSIEPYEDCCTVFLPKRPVTKPRLEKVNAAEENLDRAALIAEAMNNLEFEVIEPF